MAVRRSLVEIKKTLQTKLDTAGEYYTDRIPADMGNHSGVVAVPGTVNMIYCRMSNGQVVKVFNDVAPNIYNWKVYIGRDKSQPGLLKVIEVRWVHNIAQTAAYVLFHHGQHEYPAPDTVWVMRDQFMPLLVLPNGGFHVRLYGDTIYVHTMVAPLKVANVSDIDLSSYTVTSGAHYVLMEVLVDGTLNYIVGAEYGSVDVLRLPTTPLPTPTPGAFPICAIEFYDGQTEIRRDSTERNIIDLRMFTASADANAAYQWHSQPETTTLSDADEFGIWNTANSLMKKITWRVFQSLIQDIVSPMIEYQMLMRWNGAVGQTTFELPDVATRMTAVLLNGLEEDPFVYNLSADGTQLVLDNALTSATTVMARYYIRKI